MTVPGFQAFMLPILDVLQDDQPRRSRDVVAAVADSLHLSQEDRQTINKSGQPMSSTALTGRSHTCSKPD